MQKIFIIGLLIVVTILTGCDKGAGNDPNSTGKGSEILVVCEKVTWDGTVGNEIRQALTKEMDGLPESEPEYTLINVPYAKFSRFLQTHRNVLIIDINATNGKGGIESQKNTWSRPQRVIKVLAGSDTAFTRIFAQYRPVIKELFNQNERARFAAQNALSRNHKMEAALLKEFGIQMMVSSDFYLAKQSNDFIWLRKETNEMSLGLLVYSYPYNDTSQLALSKILLKRNEITSTHIPGPAEGSYMVVADEVIKPVSAKVNFKGSYAIETRGLWETHGDFMGGPFINYTVIDTLKNRILSFDGYVYYPNKGKRNYIRQLESIIWGAEWNPTPTAKK